MVYMRGGWGPLTHAFVAAHARWTPGGIEFAILAFHEGLAFRSSSIVGVWRSGESAPMLSESSMFSCGPMLFIPCPGAYS
jgi:hypothetical protein